MTVALAGVRPTATRDGVLAAGYHNPVDASGGARVMTLPTATDDTSVVAVEKTDSSSSTVTVAGNIRGSATSVTLQLQHEVVHFVSRAADESWWPVSDAKPLAQVDARFQRVWTVTPSGDTSGATDAAAIQAALNSAAAAASAGSLRTVKLFGSYTVNATVQVPGLVVLDMHGASVKAANGSNLDAVIASPAALTTAAGQSYDAPVTIRGGVVDGNRANQTAGQGYGILVAAGNIPAGAGASSIEDVLVRETRGPGICMSEVNLGGNTLAVGAAASSAVEPRIVRNRVYNAGSWGIWQRGGGSSNMTDGYMVDNIVGFCTLDGIRVDSAGGWKIDGNHVYGAGLSGILVQGSFSTRIVDNYIEGIGVLDVVTQFGASSAFCSATTYAAGTTYSLGQVAVSGGTIYRSLVDGNIGNTPSTSPTQWAAYAGGANVAGIVALASNSARPITIKGNQISLGHSSWGLNANFSYVGIWVQGPGSGTSKVTAFVLGNDIANELQAAGTNTTTVKYSGTGAGPSGCNPIERDNATRGNWNSTRAADSTSGPTGNVGAGASGGTGSSITVTGNNQCGTITVVSGSTGLAAGALATVNFTGTLNPAPRISIAPRDSASAALGPLYVTTSTTAFTLNSSVAPGVNQTYKYDYVAMVGA